MVVVSRNQGGAYIICELDGTLLHSPIAAFRVVPYQAREHIDIPDLEQHIDVSVSRLRELESSTSADPDESQDQDSGVAEDNDNDPADLGPEVNSDEEGE